MPPARPRTALQETPVAAAYLGPGPREGLCPPTQHRSQRCGGIGVPGDPASRARRDFGAVLAMSFPPCLAAALGRCQDLQAPPAYTPTVPEPPPRCQGGCLSLPWRRGTPGCRGTVAPSPSSSLGPHLPGTFAPRASQALPGQHRIPAPCWGDVFPHQLPPWGGHTPQKTLCSGDRRPREGNQRPSSSAGPVT